MTISMLKNMECRDLTKSINQQAIRIINNSDSKRTGTETTTEWLYDLFEDLVHEKISIHAYSDKLFGFMRGLLASGAIGIEDIDELEKFIIKVNS